jgi:hypothetical protein
MHHCDCGSHNLINIIYPPYGFAFPLCVYAKLFIFVPTQSPSPQMLCLSHILSLSLSLSLSDSPLVSSLPLFLCHTKKPMATFSIIDGIKVF